LAALTESSLQLVISPITGGLASQLWHDWRNTPHPQSPQELVVAVQQQLGWATISMLAFPATLLDSEGLERAAGLRKAANDWLQSAIAEAEKLAKTVRLNPIFRGRDFLVEKDLCFVLMPFREPFLRLFQDHIKPTLEAAGLRVPHGRCDWQKP